MVGVNRENGPQMSLLKLDVARWYAVYTKPRAEKRVADRLSREGIHTYCPTYTTIRQWSDRRKKVVLPVFVSYVFVHVKRNQYHQVLKDPGVLNYVFYLGKVAIVSDSDIISLKQFLGDLKPDEYPVSRTIQPGDRVKVETGPLAGFEGIVNNGTRRKVFVFIDPLGIIVEIDKVKVRSIV